jgi:hypothetical protein
MQLETTCDNHSFPIFHQMIYELIQFWAKTDAAKYYPFYEIWENWEGVISSTSHFRAIKHWMQIITLQDYMDAVHHCPYIADNFLMDWDANSQSNKWHAKHLPMQTAFDPPNFNCNVVNKVNFSETDSQLSQASSQESSPQEAQPFITSDAFRALLTDFQDEHESEGTTHTNRFLHFLQDKINGIMGNWGNQIKNAEKQLDVHLTKFDQSVQDIENCFVQFRSVCSARIYKNNEEVTTIDAKVSFHLVHMQERADRCVSNQPSFWTFRQSTDSHQ